jgi:hypothetical protein
VTTTSRLGLGAAAVFLALGGGLWLLLASIEPATYTAINDELLTIGTWMLWIAAVGQTAFVGLWFSLPWWRIWIGRALMVKSLALGVYLDFALVLHYVTPFPGLLLLSMILFGFITVGIWSQLVALVLEVSRARRRRTG